MTRRGTLILTSCATRAFAVVALVALLVQPTGARQTLPGVCDGAGSIGVGCGFDMFNMELYGATLNPKAKIIEHQSCPIWCYLEDGVSSASDCYGCVVRVPGDPDSNREYNVPAYSVAVDNSSYIDECFESYVHNTTEQYKQSLWSHTSSHHCSWFHCHSSSTTTHKFAASYYQQDAAFSQFYKGLTKYSVSLLPIGLNQIKLSPTIREALALLPPAYETDPLAYQQLLDDFGSHVMTSANMGGLALQTMMFHSCMVAQCKGEYVQHSSSSSWFGLFHHHGGGGSGFNDIDEFFAAWSEAVLTLVGGDALSYGTLDRNHTMGEAECIQWERGVYDAMMPIDYTLTPLDEIVRQTTGNDTLADALAQALSARNNATGTASQALVDSLVPKDPWCQPDWCCFSPHPWTAENPDADGMRRAAQCAGNCSSMPPSPDTVPFGGQFPGGGKLPINGSELGLGGPASAQGLRGAAVAAARGSTPVVGANPTPPPGWCPSGGAAVASEREREPRLDVEGRPIDPKEAWRYNDRGELAMQSCPPLPSAEDQARRVRDAREALERKARLNPGGPEAAAARRLAELRSRAGQAVS